MSAIESAHDLAAIRRKRILKEKTFKFCTYAFFAFLTIITIYPLFWLFYSSFKPQIEILKDRLAFPINPTISNYVTAWTRGNLGLYFTNSIIYTLVATSGILMFSMMCAYAFTKMRVKATPVLFNLLLIGLLITLNAILIPLFLLENRLGVNELRIGIIIPYIAVNLPMATFFATEFMRGLPDSLVESGKIDGASNWAVFLRIILPMTKPVLVTLGILNFMYNWNEFLLCFVLSNDSLRSVPVGIMSFAGPFATQYGLQFASLVIGLLPMLVVYIALNGKITQGVVGGSVKE